MRTLCVDVGHTAYDIHIGSGLLRNLSLIASKLPQPRAVVVTNETIAPLYLPTLLQGLAAAGIEAFPVVLPDGEQYKTLETLNQIFDALLSHQCERKTTLIALGGGVIGDMTGFAAAVYQRGVPFIQIPTTLLAQVDSSVGGKTAVNHPLGKNMLGAFYQPQLVLADLDTLKTLPDREYSAGLAEVIKYGLIDDLPFFEWLEAHMPALMQRDIDTLAQAIEHSCRNKARIVAADEREQGVRALLNLGHTFGHAIETALGYGTWLHGEAVAAGIVLAAHASRQLDQLSANDVARIERLIAQAKLPTAAPALGLDRWMTLMAQDKKVEAGSIRFVLMRSLGQAYLGSLDHAVLSQILS